MASAERSERALAALGVEGELQATLVDQDPQALALASRIATAARGEGGVTLRVRTVTSDLGHVPSQEADLVLVGQALSEMNEGLPAAERVARQVAWLHERLESNVTPGGALVVVEPALRERSRHLHQLRAGLIAQGWSVFAPCLHDLGCPMMANDRDWCHRGSPRGSPGLARPHGAHRGPPLPGADLQLPGAPPRPSSEMKGFIGYDLTENKLVHPNFYIGKNKTPMILKILEDTDGNLYLGSTSGMYKYDREQSEIKEIKEILIFNLSSELSLW